MRYSMLFLAGMILFQGCGYSLRMVDVAEENRDLRNKREMEEQVSRLDAEMKSVQEQVTRLQSELKQAREESRKAVSDIQKRRADMDVRLDESDVQSRIIHGKIEKEERRRADLTQQVDNVAFRLSEQEKKWQAQIDEIKKISGSLQKNVEDQDKRLKEMTGQILQLTREIPPSLSAQAAQLDELGKQIHQMNRGTDVDQLSKSLVDLSKALDLLGEKITAKVDEQEKLLSKTTKRLQVLESKVTPRGKQSSLPEENPEGPTPGEAEGAANASWYDRDGF